MAVMAALRVLGFAQFQIVDRETPKRLETPFIVNNISFIFASFF